jgi:cysteine synthase/rhodanese-related sulfurtransferase
VLDPTPLEDLTEALMEFAAGELRADLSSKNPRVYGKFDSRIAGGSVKVRPAVQIVSEAIGSGRLTRERTVFEATSGNFGLALAMLGKLDLRVVALVSRKLQPGVIKELGSAGVRLINLDIDICPAPGFKGDADLLVAKGIASSVRQQLGDAGLGPDAFDAVRGEAEALLARQDVISLAKLLAQAYGGYCPEQYDNEMNVRAHETITGPEVDQQLNERGSSLATFDLVCALGTGGTATGLSRYAGRVHSRKPVHVVYPLPDQDVAGIRTREKARGLRFYSPGEYASENEVDFEKARRLLDFMNGRGHDVGESGALALYGCLELIQSGKLRNAVVVIADGASKYATAPSSSAAGTEVTLQGARDRRESYSAVVWTHGALAPNDAGVRAIASAVGVEERQVRVARVREVQSLLDGSGTPEVFDAESGRRLLLVCMVGGTSLMVAKALADRGIAAESLAGGITGIPSLRGRPPLEYLGAAVA